MENNNKSLKITNIAPDDVGYYECIALNKFHNDTTEFFFNVIGMLKHLIYHDEFGNFVELLSYCKSNIGLSKLIEIIMIINYY